MVKTSLADFSLRQQPEGNLDSSLYYKGGSLRGEFKRGVSPSSKEIFPFPSEGKGIKGIG